MRKLMIASVLVLVSTALLVTGVVLWSATRSDEIAGDRQARIVALALQQSMDKIPYDQESVAIWDDSVVNVRDAFNRQWTDTNLGVWMYDYFKHDRTFVLDAGNRPLYAMADGKETVALIGSESEPVATLAATLRARIRDGALDDYESGKSRLPRVVDLAIIEQRPAIISATPLVSDTGAIVQERGSECLIVSVRFLDGNFLEDLAGTYLLSGVRYTRANDLTASEHALPLNAHSGAEIGRLVWVPELQGWKMLIAVMPVFALGLAAVGGAIVFLIRTLRSTYTELLRSEIQSKHLAFHDSLTGLPNRAFFNVRLEKALADVRRGHGPMALMFLDLDRFKQVNDTLGHPAGDALIRKLATRLTAVLQPSDFLARMGGDEFAIIRAGAACRADVEALCGKILADVLIPFDVMGNQATVGISIGIAMSPEAGVDRSELARKADIALYQAKTRGRQSFQFFTEEMSETLQERQTLESDLRRALETGVELEVVYQPVYSAGTLEIAGAEALVRWNHPRLGVVPPLAFVPIAEDCGLIHQLGEKVLRDACRAAAAWDLKTIAVNASPVQLLRSDFAERFLAILGETGIEPFRLEIELTESTLLDTSAVSASVLKALRDAGVSIALDDFGTGYSSLSYLTMHEVDRVKIDQTFVRDLASSASAVSIVEAVVTMAHAVGLVVTAEGVETTEQRDILTRIGCNELQGYLLSRPLSALAMTGLLADSKRASRPASVLSVQRTAKPRG